MGVMPRFDYHRPRSLAEAIDLLAHLGAGAQLIAGGTDLVVQMKAGARSPAHLVSLNDLPELAGLSVDPDMGLRVGAAVRVSAVGAHPTVRADYPALAHACSVMATTQVRHMATVAGNVANGSPCADTSAPLLAYGARAQIVGPQGERFSRLSSFFRGPKQVDLQPGEILVALQMPLRAPRSGSDYQRLSARSRVDMAAVGVAGLIELGEDGAVARSRLALSAVGPTPLRCRDAEAMLLGQRPDEALLDAVAAACAAAARPIDDVRATARWRRHVTGVLARRVLGVSLQRAGEAREVRS